MTAVSVKNATKIGLARVKAEAPDADYRRLRSAIDYLLVFDLSMQRDRTRPHRKRDGMTPAEVMAKIEH